MVGLFCFQSHESNDMSLKTIEKAKLFFTNLAAKNEPAYYSGALGIPSRDDSHYFGRMNYMRQLRQGRGFRFSKQEPSKRFNGMTRGEVYRAKQKAFREAYSPK